ncbi:spore germination protein [Rossellomorea sp. DUT-2]
MKSVGVPYLSPIIPFKMQELKDTFYREDLQAY